MNSLEVHINDTLV